MTIKPIPTRYKGHHFRSRLEARWAVLLDHLGIEWKYEDQGFDLGEEGHYLPDFWLPEFNTFLEVKPAVPDEQSEETQKLYRLAELSGYCCMWATEIGDSDSIPVGDVLGRWGVTGSWEGVGPIEYEAHNHFDSCRGYNGCSYQVVCPVCGSDYCHISSVAISDGSRHECSSKLGYQGPEIISIRYWSEHCSHNHVQEICFHKGNTYVGVYCDSQNVFSHLTWFLQTERTSEQRLAACRAARSARFEHGQSGAT